MDNEKIMQRVKEQIDFVNEEKSDFPVNSVGRVIYNYQLAFLAELLVDIESSQPQGVTVWISWDSNMDVAPEVWVNRPHPNSRGMYNRDTNSLRLSEIVNISPGECKQFRIVEVV